MGKDFTPKDFTPINIDKNHNRKKQISGIAKKLKKANGILSKLRHFIDRKTLKSIYDAICYSSLVWEQNSNSITRLFILQKNPYRLYIS